MPLRRWFGSIAPGVITAALVFGPGKVTILCKMGADYGNALIWIIFVVTFFMAVFTTMGARIGLAAEHSFLFTVREKWGRGVTVATGTGVFLVCAAFQTGNSVGVGISLGELLGVGSTPVIIVVNLLAISFLFVSGLYRLLQKLMIALVIIILFAFLVTMILSRPEAGAVLSGIVPSIPGGSVGLVISFVASSFSVVGACYQSYLVQERRRMSPDAKLSSRDPITGIVILGVMALIVMICSAFVLHPHGLKVNSGTDMARALEPLFGRYASAIFLSGLFAASLSAMVGNATLGGTLFADALGAGGQLNSKTVRILIAVIMIIGASLAIAFGRLPIQLLILAQTVTILIVPFIGLAMFLIANDRAVMGRFVNSTTERNLSGLGLLLLFILAIQSFFTIFV